MRSRKEILDELELVRERLKVHHEAECKILRHSQANTTGSTQLTRASLPAVQKGIKDLEKREKELEQELCTGGKRSGFRVILRDV